MCTGACGTHSPRWTRTGAEPYVARRRLDAELVRRSLARSREHASQLIAAGRVTVGGTTATKAATQVETSAAVVVARDSDEPDYVSRGGHKLAGAFAAFLPRGLTVEGSRALDAGASTGGFTDVLLRAGAAEVVAVDVGYGQLAWSLRSDDRVTVKDRTNVRELTLDHLGGTPVDLVVGDLSFIPLGLVLPALVRCAAPDADLVLMVKPQFEVGRERLGSGGVVRSTRLRAESVQKVAAQAAELGLGVLGVTASPLPGPSGNVEYFLWLRAGAPDVDPADVDRAVAEGPR
jgi:23S rRNA (cytidine1920-2'-O)/16S rRNA (cytidine1409-2'-O)-methyltransferase